MGMAVLRYKPTYYLMSGQNSKPIGMRTTVFRDDGGSHGLLDMRSHKCLAPQYRITLNLMGVWMPNLRFIFPSPPAMRYLKSQPLTLSVLQAHPP